MIKTFINIDSLKERTADDRELALELLELLKSLKDDYYFDIIESIELENFKELSSELHKFKSAIAILGFDNLVDEIVGVEKKAVKKMQAINYSSKINRIFISLNNHIVELEKILKE